MKTIIAFAFLTSAITMQAVASDSFLIGATPETLRESYGSAAVQSSSDSELTFDTQLGGVRCTIVYRLEKQVAVGALCLVETKNRRFADSLKDFRAILDCVLKDGKVSGTSVRLNGVTIIDGSHALEGPKNYIRVSGEWRSGYYFTARLDGDDTTEIESAGVVSLSVSVNRNVEPPTVHEESSEPHKPTGM